MDANIPDAPQAREARQVRRPVQAPSGLGPEQEVTAYLERVPAGRRGINFGCGGMTYEGWLNIDRGMPLHTDIDFDMAAGLPFLPGDQFDAALSEAFLEHVERPVAERILRDVFRALRPGGTLRIAIPDLRDLIRIYLEGEQHPAANGAIERTFGAVSGTACELHNYATRGEGHVYMYDRAEIDWLFRHCGFVDVRACEIGRSTIPLLHDRENRPASEMSLITEGTKP